MLDTPSAIASKASSGFIRRISSNDNPAAASASLVESFPPDNVRFIKLIALPTSSIDPPPSSAAFVNR
jgi:hypothetical protein